MAGATRKKRNGKCERKMEKDKGEQGGELERSGEKKEKGGVVLDDRRTTRWRRERGPW